MAAEYRYGTHEKAIRQAGQYAAVFGSVVLRPQGFAALAATFIVALSQFPLDQPQPVIFRGSSPGGGAEGTAPPLRPALFAAPQPNLQQPPPVIFRHPPPAAGAGAAPSVRTLLFVPQELPRQSPSFIINNTEHHPTQPMLQGPWYQGGTHRGVYEGGWTWVRGRAQFFPPPPAQPPARRPFLVVAPQVPSYQPCGILPSYNVHWKELLSCTQLFTTGHDLVEQSRSVIVRPIPAEAPAQELPANRSLQAAPQDSPEQFQPVVFRQQLTSPPPVDAPPLAPTLVVIPQVDLEQPPAVLFHLQAAEAPLGDPPPIRPFYGPTEEPPYQPSWFQATNVALIEFVLTGGTPPSLEWIDDPAEWTKPLQPGPKRKTSREELEDVLDTMGVPTGVTIGLATPPAAAEEKLEQVPTPEPKKPDDDDEADALFLLLQ